MIAQAVQMERTDERMSRMLFYNGTMITMEEPVCAQAVLTEDGVIRAVGTFEDVRAAAGFAGTYPDARIYRSPQPFYGLRQRHHAGGSGGGGMF